MRHAFFFLESAISLLANSCISPNHMSVYCYNACWVIGGCACNLEVCRSHVPDFMDMFSQHQDSTEPGDIFVQYLCNHATTTIFLCVIVGNLTFVCGLKQHLVWCYTTQRSKSIIIHNNARLGSQYTSHSRTSAKRRVLDLWRYSSPSHRTSVKW